MNLGSLFSGGPLGVLGGLVDTAASAFQAERNQDFAEKQMKNKWQWQVQDMKKAGINPIYGLGGSPPTPSGASSISSRISESATSAYGAETQRRGQESQASVNAADVELKLAETARTGVERERLKEDMQRIKADVLRAYAETDRAKQEGALASATYNLRLMEAQQIRDLLPFLTALRQIDVYRASLGLPAAENAASSERTWWAREVIPILKNVGASISNVTGLGPLLESLK